MGTEQIKKFICFLINLKYDKFYDFFVYLFVIFL